MWGRVHTPWYQLGSPNGINSPNGSRASTLVSGMLAAVAVTGVTTAGDVLGVSSTVVVAVVGFDVSGE